MWIGIQATAREKRVKNYDILCRDSRTFTNPGVCQRYGENAVSDIGAEVGNRRYCSTM